MRVARSFAAILILATVTAIASEPHSPARAAERAPIVQPAAGAAWGEGSVAALRHDLDAMLASSGALTGAHYGMYAVDTSTGRVLYSSSGDSEFQAASTFKLIVGSVALDRLGPSFRFRTTLSLAWPKGGKPIAFPYPATTPAPMPSPSASALGAVPGPPGPAADTPAPVSAPPDAPALLLTFGGDPTLSRGDLRAAANALTIPRYEQTYVDDSAFDTTPYANGWTWDDFGQDYAPRISAATVDENVIGVTVAPGDDVGDPAMLAFKDGRPFAAPSPGPANEDRCDGAPLDFVRSRATTGAKGSDDTIDVAPYLSGCERVVGSIPLGASPETLGLPFPDPVAAIGAMFDRYVHGRNIYSSAIEHVTTFESPDAFAPRPNLRALDVDPPVWTHDSQPLGELLGPSFWIPSDNLFGELLLKQIGLQTGGKPGTTAKGIAYEKTWLRGLGIDTTTLTMADACGMSQYDRVTPHDLVAVLQHDWNGPNRRLVLDSLPVGGSRGTIEGIAGTPAAGRVFAKTGSMMHVRGLAGFLSTVRHGPVTFDFSVDDWNGDYGALAALRARVLARIISSD